MPHANSRTITHSRWHNHSDGDRYKYPYPHRDRHPLYGHTYPYGDELWHCDCDTRGKRNGYIYTGAYGYGYTYSESDRWALRYPRARRYRERHRYGDGSQYSDRHRYASSIQFPNPCGLADRW